MKLGDLVVYTEGGRPEAYDHMGLIIDGPRTQGAGVHEGMNRWEVFWMYCNKTGWWDEHQMEVICESG